MVFVGGFMGSLTEYTVEDQGERIRGYGTESHSLFGLRAFHGLWYQVRGKHTPERISLHAGGYRHRGFLTDGQLAGGGAQRSLEVHGNNNFCMFQNDRELRNASAWCRKFAGLTSRRNSNAAVLLGKSSEPNLDELQDLPPTACSPT
jgi:hypothetical protein